ncbi:uncharacterized protein E0L32_010459 [Thyridium curvatum]|uniref:histidine kinase n=1 Tax=Thyridium curvatum TaxID=1093900 RepID=A0A507ANH2_9PEZI|nr:uncharacterized protein E0L32_010459 [Thyridium curvatum]TPX07884.1 hypothetical protein E0L32_010459 [Thyridium curvatum]
MSGRLKSGQGAPSPRKEVKSPTGSTHSEAAQETGKAAARTTSRRDSDPQKDVRSHKEEGQPEKMPKKQLSDYREQLVREMSARGAQTSALPKRPSPIQEETTSSPLMTSSDRSSSDVTTTSTESGNTIRGGMTPGFTARTPSYPFPRMGTPGYTSSALHRPFTTLSPTGPQGVIHEGGSIFDRVLSNPSTPSSNITFQPGNASYIGGDNPDFPTPSLYDLTLMLSAEPGLDAWWNTVVQIMTECYGAERVTLAVPADSTDIENVPWGQKATFNIQPEDELSMGYMARGSSMVPSSTGDPSEGPSHASETQKLKLPLRPTLASRHSFTTYENKKEKAEVNTRLPATAARPPMPRSQSSYPVSTLREEMPADDSTHLELSRSVLEEHNAEEEEHPIPSWEAPIATHAQVQGRVLPVLQALDYEADPLIDHNGVQRVLDRGRVIALTRSYPYLDPESRDKSSESLSRARSQSPEGPRKLAKKMRSDSSTKLSSLLGNANMAKDAKSGDARKSRNSTHLEDAPRPKTPRYEEYEQAPPSPWSQSPAPSPAIRADPNQNPFFTDAMVDEESFNPGPATHDYTSMKPPETIGVDNSYTVLHIPLSHVILSKPAPAFKLDTTILDQKSSSRGKSDATPAEQRATSNSSPEPASKPKQTPIAILSILSPVIPYPSNLRRSIEALSAHLATSFSLCRHYSNLEAEVVGLHRRRHDTPGFGALGTDGRMLVDSITMSKLGYIPPEDLASQMSLGGSITSPSDYSGPSHRSAADSPAGTPNWDTGTFGLIVDKRTVGSSPGQVTGDSYFNTRPATSPGRPPTTPGGGSAQRLRRNSKELSNIDKRSSLRRTGSKAPVQDALIMTATDFGQNEGAAGDVPGGLPDEMAVTGLQQKRVTLQEAKENLGDNRADLFGESSAQQPALEVVKKSTAASGPLGQAPHRHSLLHSYGADFTTTFQSLPPSSSISVKGTPYMSAPSRSGSISVGQVDMPPPSDRLKGLILDSLPSHVFVALPQTGAIVWVNSRFLSYRGQTVTDLAQDPWGSIHPDEREEYLKAWSHSVRTGDQFSRTVRIRRFDGAYRFFQARAIATRDKRNVITQFLGSYMDIHDQHIAELKAIRQEEIESSEAKHRLLANLIPQIIFTATEDEGITFANQQWLSYTGQSTDDPLGLGFMDFVHPEDLAKCRVPTDMASFKKQVMEERDALQSSPSSPVSTKGILKSLSHKELLTSNIVRQALSRQSSSSSTSGNEGAADLASLVRKGIIKITEDSEGRPSYTTEVRLRSKTGEYRWHLVRCVEIQNMVHDDGTSSYFGSATDINDHKLLEAKLKEAMESKGRFLSNMSHEIRTPLIGISGMVSFLQDTVLNEEQRDYTNTIQTSANSLLMIINDILDLSKVDAGMMKLNYEWFHTRSLIEDVNELVSTMAIAKRLELNYVVESDVPAWVKGDRVRIRQVLLNVIGNAIKFTSQGEVFSHCRVVPPNDGEEPDETGIMLEFSIIDTGRGFTKEEAELIFKPFSQIDGSSTRQHGGSGLGLVISRQLVELHGGKMDGTAVPGKGSTFTFTARFILPTSEDHPDIPASPPSTATTRAVPEELQVAHPARQLSTVKPLRLSPGTSPTTDVDPASSVAASSGSSDPSIKSGRSRVTERSSMSSVNVGLVHFSEAARASGQDLSQMKLEMPSERSSPGTTPLSDETITETEAASFRPPMYSILVICPQKLSREATKKHIEMTLPKDVPYQIAALASIAEAEMMLSGDEAVNFTHIVINLPSPEEIMNLMDKLMDSPTISKARLVILTDSVQRQAVMKLAAGTKHEDILSETRVSYVYKPVKPSRFAVIFDPAKERDISIDRNRSSAQRLVETQKQSYLNMERRMGNKGFKVLLVEDNLINQKVLTKYLKKVGVEVDIASDGVECVDKVFSHPGGYYSFILCDLHMPRKDGYQACREIRAWETEHKYKPMPIIALSANVMSDVQKKCAAAGFNDYVSKPVDFIALSSALCKFF